MNNLELRRVLRHIGFIGTAEIDFSNNKVKATGSIGRTFGIDETSLSDGVPLQVCDAAIVAHDLEAMRRHRRATVHRPGVYHLSYAIHSPDADEPIEVQSIMKVSADRFGLAKRASGILIRGGTLKLRADNDEVSPDTLIRVIKAGVAYATQLGFSAEAIMLSTVCNIITREISLGGG